MLPYLPIRAEAPRRRDAAPPATADGARATRLGRWAIGLRILFVAGVASANVTYYLAGTGTGSDVPVGSLTLTVPTRTTLPNYDPARDPNPGLTLQQTKNGFNENDAKKHQWWLIGAGGSTISGSIKLKIWAAIKDYKNDKHAGALAAYLADCNATASSCTLITSASKSANPWGAKGGFVENTLTFGSVNYTIPAGRYLGLKIVRPNNAKEDMWLAYDTVSFASQLTIAPVTVVLGAFNAFDADTAANALSGPIRTKIAGQSFVLSIIHLNDARTAYDTDAIGPLRVELVDASDDSGAMNAATGCRASWTTIAVVSDKFSFAGGGKGDGGRKALSFTLNRAAPNVRVRVTHDGSGKAGCSNNNFAVRPLAFTSVQATDGTDTTTGTARVLDNGSASTGVVHRAGRDFTVLGAAVNANGTTVTPGYDGMPMLTVASCVLPAGCEAGGLWSGLAAVDGVVTGSGRYHEAGVITATLQDSAFAAVDEDDSTDAERTISSGTVTIGRFVPDAYQLAVATTPQFAPGLCGAGPALQPFTYVGQPFSFAVAPVVLATPLNADGEPLVNARPRYVAAAVSNTVSATGAPVALAGSTTVAGIAHGATSNISFAAGSFSFTRGAAPVASFAPTLSMTVSLADTTENATAGNSTISSLAPLVIAPIAFAGGAGSFHYGRAQLRPAYGDVRRELYAPLEVQRFNGLGWIGLPEAGTCLAAPPTSFAYSNATALLDAGGGTPNCASRVAATVTTSGGRAAIRLDKPGAVTTAQPSAMTMTLNLLDTPAGTSCNGATPTAAVTAAAPWLANPDGSNPAARLTWGRSRGELLGLRERFD
jgi:MSHA biogenesis protein MshQ